MKIAILGYSGSGKSTLAKKIGEYYKAPVLHLDSVNFLPDWVERDIEEGRYITHEFMKNESWVIDGNYTAFYQRERLEQADKIIILDFPRRIYMYRAAKRYLENRNRTREDMAKGCVEKLDFEFTWWILYKGRTKEKRKHYKEIEQKFQEKVVVLEKPKDLDDFINLGGKYGN